MSSEDPVHMHTAMNEPDRMAPIIHIVLFEFSPTATSDQIHDVCTRFLELRRKCVNPMTKRSYIDRNFSGGRNNSPEGKAGKITHGFVIEFDTLDDRDYYLHKDPAHQEFIGSLEGVVVNSTILDYEPGVF